MSRSLSAKILLGLLAIVLAAILAAMFVTRRLREQSRGAQAVRSTVLAFHADQAQRALERDGPGGLQSYLDRLDGTLPRTHALVDAAGRDLRTGADLRRTVARASELQPFLRRPMVPPVLVASTSDGRHRLLAIAAGDRTLSALPYYGLILTTMAALTYLLVLMLIWPLGRLRTSVERFGAGDLAVRTRSRRKDEIGDVSRAFDHMADRIETLLGAEKRLLLDVSHELRSPLARLGLAVALLRTGEEHERALACVAREVARLGELVDGLLQVTRWEGDPSVRHADEVAVDDLLRRVGDACAVEADARGCRLSLQVSSGVRVAGDPELLRRVIENVVRNAIRHAPAHTVVDITLEREDGVAILSVRDYGPGVPDAALDRLFDPFFRVESHRSRDSGGVGLGLSIARRAVDVHGGRIHAANTNPGLRIEIVLPASKPGAPRSSIE